MKILEISFITIFIYLFLAIAQSLHLYGKLNFPKWMLLMLGFCGVSLHAFILYRGIDTPLGQNLSISNIFSLISFGMAVLTLFTSVKKPVENLMIFIFPMATFSILGTLIWPGYDLFKTREHPGSLIHILISITAFSTLGMAALQATLLRMQNRLLRNKRPTAMVRILPPLQTMESLLFQIVWLGFLLLSASLGTAFLLESLFTISHLQKIILSFLAWGLFATLIYGHHYLGWRGPTAVRWTLLGTSLLTFAYFGSKLILLDQGN